MRELWQRLGRLNQISLIIVAIVVIGVFTMLVVMSGPTGVIVTVASAALIAFCFWFFFHDEVRNNRIRRGGTHAEATILEVRETGITIQGNYPVAKLRLRVEPATGEPYEATTKCLMSRFEIPAYQPGNRISVLVDPRNPKRIAVA